MQVTILGEKMRVDVLILCLLVGGFIACMTVCSCAGGIKEGMDMLMGAPLDWSMGKEIKGGITSWEAEDKDNGYDTWFQHLKENKGGSVPPEHLYMFQKNEARPECCSSTYSVSNGCLCVSEDQMKFLNKRGGNRTFTTEF